MRRTHDYQYESPEEEGEEEEEEKEQQNSKKPHKKEPLKKPTKEYVSKFNEWVNKKEIGINSEMFQNYFSFQRASDMLKDLYRIIDKYKNNELVNIIKSGLINLKNETENMSEE